MGAARGGNRVSPTSANPIRATLVGPRLDTVLVPGSGFGAFDSSTDTSSCSRLSGISDVAEASCGYPLTHESRTRWFCSSIGNTICGGIFAPLSFIIAAVKATRICELPEV